MGSHSVGLGADSAPAGLRRRAARWAAGGVAIAAALGGGIMAAPAAMAVPTIPVACSTTALRSAIFFSPSNSILVLHSGCVYFIGSALPTVTRNLTIVGSNDTFRATGSGYTMLTNIAPNLQISHLTIRNGRNTGGFFRAGAILNIGSHAGLTVSNVTFFNNEGRDGGAIFNTLGAELTVANSTFLANEAVGTGSDGGAIGNAPGSATTVSGTTFTDNEAVSTGSDGGAIASLGGTVTVQAPANVFTRNFARDDGGAIASLLGTLNVARATFTGNQADDDGGAVANFGALSTLSQDGFTANLAEENGGGVATASATNLTSDTFSLNRADRFGGGLYVRAGTSKLDTTDIFLNRATGPGFAGGGIFRVLGATVSFAHNVIVKLNAPNNCTNLFCP